MTLSGRAEALLESAVDGHGVPREEAEAIARAWLELTGAHVAMRVLTGGAHEAADVVELCERILRAVDELGDDEAKGSS